MTILRKSALLPILLSARTTTAYFTQVNNAHVEFAATGTIDTHTGDSTVETVDDRSSLQHTTASLWNALEGALELQGDLGFAAPKIMGLFEEWVERFGKEYGSLEEKSGRMLVWLENHVLIETHNSKKSSFTLGHNEFSDMTHAEFRERMRLGEFETDLVMREGKEFKFLEFNEEEEENSAITNSRLRGPAESATERKLQSTTAATTTDEKDWHQKGLMGPIRNQGICGACWAFSAIGSIESAMAIDKYNKMTPAEQAEQMVSSTGGVKNDLGLVIPLSEQNLIDCDTLHEKGCKGGL
mmetsp:Transcript_30342/g.52558  ORF Transcript_30342/g.52558 Transcript_30342/m.52558 type:complete len:298 (+) Transcript_30342:74-967(+)